MFNFKVFLQSTGVVCTFNVQVLFFSLRKKVFFFSLRKQEKKKDLHIFFS